MARFLTKPIPEKLENLWYRLPEDLLFEFTLKEALGSYPPALSEFCNLGIHQDEKIYVVVPKGFVTDLASVPLPLTSIVPRDGTYTPAAIVHDLVYQSLKNKTVLNTAPHRYHPIHQLNKKHTQYFADRLFLIGMRALGVNSVLRGAMYNAVRAAGSGSYGVNPMKENYGLEITHRFSMGEPYLIFREEASVGVEPSIYEDLIKPKPKAVALHYPNLKRAFAYSV
jgi:hypothetical protein